jgi:hypothetical protein
VIRAFLSHSSKDKDNYIRKVAETLGKDNIIYDEFTFEEGEKPLEEILKGIDKTSLFVIFLSEHSLESKWVKKEITAAKKKLDDDLIQKIYPIIIDNKITFEDSRIPDWMRENYNIKLIKRPQVSARRVHNKLRELSWSKHPEIKARNTIFVGRNDKQEQFEERIHDFDKSKPIVIIASGFAGVGRRTFLHRALYKTNITEISHKPSPILLDRNVSIEDFILKLNDLGLVDLNEEVLSLASKSIELKIALIHEIMDAAYNASELIYLVDDGCIVNYERAVSDWFTKTINSYKNNIYPIFCIASKYKVIVKNRPKSDRYFFIELNELNANERKRLLSQLLELYTVSLRKDDFEAVTNLLFGYPDQVMFAVDLIKEDNLTPLFDKLPIIADYNSDKASTLLRKHETNDKALDFIRLLAQFEVITSDFIFSIVQEAEYYPLLEELAAEHIVEFIGIDGEIIRLNDIVRDFIKRNRLKLRSDFTAKIETQVERTINSDDIFEKDSSEFIFTLKEALKNNLKIDERLLIPSHYLRCMKDIYYSKGSLERIIELADIILQKKDSLEAGVLQDIRYYLCLALAKKKEDRVLYEVQHIKGDEHNFILGYYYRLCGRLKDALDQFEKIVNAKYVGARAKREIVQVYVQLEEYDKALIYAKRNYEENRGNQFHIQAYFNCLINSENPEAEQHTLKRLIQDLININSEQSNEMAQIAEALYIARVEHNETASTDKIRDCVNQHPDDYYPLLAMCDIAIKYNSKKLLQEGYEALGLLSKKKSLSTRTTNRYKAYIYAFDGETEKAIEAVNGDLARYPNESKVRIINRITEISENFKQGKLLAR